MENNKNPFHEDNVENKENKENEDIKEVKDEEVQEETAEQEETAQEENVEKNDELQQKFDELNNKYLRLAADFDNFRKRTATEKEELSKYACCDLLKKIATTLDTFDRAQEHLKEIEDVKVVKESYEVAYKQFLETLKKIGMEEIECLGKEFNPNEHEAISQIPTDEYDTDSVAVVMQKGYKLQDKVIRPALVGVAVKKED